MSLKSFHLFFIGASILLSLGCLYASVQTFMSEPAGIHLTSVVLAAGFSAVLVAYALRAARRFRKMGGSPDHKATF